MDANFETKVILTVLNSLNILLTGVLIISFMTSSKLKNHPAGIIISLAFCELATSYHSSIFMWGSENSIKFLTIDKMRIWGYVGLKDVTFVTCTVNVVIFSFGVITGILYNIILCLDLILSLRNPFSTASKRMKYYQIVVFIVTTSISGYISSELIQSTCLYKEENEKIGFHNKLEFLETQKEVIQPLIQIFIAFAVISIIYAGYRIKFGLKISNSAFKSSFIRHIMYVAVNIFVLSFVFFSIYFMENKENEYFKVFENTTGYVMSIGGIILTLIRCTDQNFRSKISSGNLFKVEYEEDEDNEWNNSLAQLTQELKSELASGIFDSLFMVYDQKKKGDTFRRL